MLRRAPLLPATSGYPGGEMERYDLKYLGRPPESEKISRRMLLVWLHMQLNCKCRKHVRSTLKQILSSVLT